VQDFRSRPLQRYGNSHSGRNGTTYRAEVVYSYQRCRQVPLPMNAVNTMLVGKRATCLENPPITDGWLSLLRSCFLPPGVGAVC
jgi:hypothetical protein